MAEHEELNIENDHNVYILGAGFSVPGGLPVITGFMNKMRDALPWMRGRSRDAEAKAIEAVLRFRQNAAKAAERVPLDLENIEQLFSLASASTDSHLIEDATLAIAATLDYARRTHQADEPMINIHQDRIADLPSSWKPHNYAPGQPLRPYSVGLYDFYALILSGGRKKKSGQRKDTIISLNYDVLLDNSFAQIGISFDYGFEIGSVDFDRSAKCVHEPDVNAIQILKPHGSVNWAMSTNSRLAVFGDYADLRGCNLSPLLIPPTWSKTFTTALTNVWKSIAITLRLQHELSLSDTQFLKPINISNTCWL